MTVDISLDFQLLSRLRVVSFCPARKEYKETTVLVLVLVLMQVPVSCMSTPPTRCRGLAPLMTSTTSKTKQVLTWSNHLYWRQVIKVR